MCKAYVYFIVYLLFSTNIIAAVNLNNNKNILPAKQAFEFLVTQKDDKNIEIITNIKDGYYLYRDKLSFTVNNIKLNNINFPESILKNDEFFGDMHVYYGTNVIEIAYQDDINEITIEFQGCAENILCYPLEKISLKLTADIYTKIPQIGDDIILNNTKYANNLSIITSLSFLISGILLTFTPCVLPILPIFTAILFKQNNYDTLKNIQIACCYSLPVMVIFTVFGILVAIFGVNANLQLYMQQPVFLYIFASIFVFFALWMFDLINIGSNKIVLGFSSFIQAKIYSENNSYIQAMLMGIASALIISPCISAPLASILLYISQSGNYIQGGLNLFMLSLGICSSIFLIAIFGTKWLPNTGEWMLRVKYIFATTILATALWIINHLLPGFVSKLMWGIIIALIASFLLNKQNLLNHLQAKIHIKFVNIIGIMLSVTAMSLWFLAVNSLINNDINTNRLTTTTYTANNVLQLQTHLNKAKSLNKQVMLEWTADWCISCKVFESRVLNDKRVQEKLLNMYVIKFDITDTTTEQKDLLDKYNLFGPPVVQFFKENEQTDKRIIGEINNPEIFLQHLNSLR